MKEEDPSKKKKVLVKVKKKSNSVNEDVKPKEPTYENRKPVVTTTVKGKDEKGSYTDTNSSQEDDTYKGSPASSKPKHTTNAWFNGLSQAQKDAHNKKVRERESKESQDATSDVTVPGKKSTNRVYDPAPTSEPKKKIMVRKWTKEEVKQPFGGHTSIGTSNDDKIIEKGYAKNKIDVSNPASKNNTYEARDFTSKETKLWERNKFSVSDNPIGKDTIGRGAMLDKRIAVIDAQDAERTKREQAQKLKFAASKAK